MWRHKACRAVLLFSVGNSSVWFLTVPMGRNISRRGSWYTSRFTCWVQSTLARTSPWFSLKDSRTVEWAGSPNLHCWALHIAFPAWPFELVSTDEANRIGVVTVAWFIASVQLITSDPKWSKLDITEISAACTAPSKACDLAENHTKRSCWFMPVRVVYQGAFQTCSTHHKKIASS